ncbi:hypothetical protein [Amycolatopsis sp.]|uniref:hypothetical protein n=1 Tax=Amycolatopsis sp. TaxID=37632 RepID=UPI002D7E31AB|nr:hypothetical protein [Amycolatopsis sp.]
MAADDLGDVADPHAFVADRVQHGSLRCLLTLRAAMAEALRAREVPAPTASLAAEIGGLAFSTGFARWVAPGSEREFAELAAEALDELMAATTTLG